VKFVTGRMRSQRLNKNVPVVGPWRTPISVAKGSSLDNALLLSTPEDPCVLLIEAGANDPSAPNNVESICPLVRNDQSPNVLEGSVDCGVAPLNTSLVYGTTGRLTKHGLDFGGVIIVTNVLDETMLGENDASTNAVYTHDTEVQV